MHYKRLLIIGVMLLFMLSLPLIAVAGSQTTETVPYFEPDTCSFGDVSGISCRWLVVPERHEIPDGKTIRLAVAILESTNANPQADPIIMLSGGPGGADVQYAAAYRSALGALLAERDVILIDQRGTGLSQPNLNCPEFADLVLSSSGLDVAGREALAGEVLSACRERLVEEGVDLSAYNSVQNAADIAALRVALGYEQVNLSGASYGTRLALTVMRDHPDGIRSVILDSSYPIESNIYLETPANFERSFGVLESYCNSDFLCRMAYPNVRETYFRVFERLNTTPATLNFVHPTSGETVEVQVDGYTLAEIVRFQFYSRVGFEYLPAMLYAANEGDYEPLIMAASPLLQITSSLSYGMFFSTQCYDEAPFTTEEEVLTAASDVPAAFGSQSGIFGAFGFNLCQIWQVEQPESIEEAAVVSDIPTLILAGEFDPITPAVGARKMSENLSNGFYVEFPATGHGALSDLCSMSIVKTFLDAPTQAPNVSCIAERSAVQFTITAMGTRPYAQIALVLLAGFGLWSVGNMALAVWKQPRGIAWRASLQAMGWVPVVGALGAIVLLLLQDGDALPWADDKGRVVESVIPLVMAIQAALIFSPDDEPALEVMLACPRRISWLLLERLGVTFICLTGIALIGVALGLVLDNQQDGLMLLVRWIPPAIFLGGIGAYTTLRSRVAAFGVTVAGLVWLGLVIFGSALLPGMPTLPPLNYIQPFLWPANPYLQPGSLSAGDYWLNRAFVLVAGIGLITLAVYQLCDEERVLLGTRKSRKQKEA